MTSRTRLHAALLAIAAAAGGLADARAPRATLVFDLGAAGSEVVVRRPPAPPEGVSPDPALVHRWVANAARAVTAYYGRFPAEVRLYVETGGNGRIGRGVTRRGAPATIHVSAGADTTEQDLHDDWVLTHEMVHLALPDLDGHAWLEEGVATYVEPIARVKAGLVTADEVWKWMLWGLPRGLPAPGDRGLDEDTRWGRTYWGGALFCLLADVRIREETGNARSLGDALRAILAAGGGLRPGWSVAEALEAGDRATGRTVLADLYRRLGREPGNVDLPRLFSDLGVARTAAGIVYDDGAPLAAVRRALARDGASTAAVPAAALLSRGFSGSALAHGRP